MEAAKFYDKRYAVGQKKRKSRQILQKVAVFLLIFLSVNTLAIGTSHAYRQFVFRVFENEENHSINFHDRAEQDMIGSWNDYWYPTETMILEFEFDAGIPEQEIEAARLDGAGEFRIFLSIGIPAGRSGIAAAMVLQFLEYWNIVEQLMIFLDSEEKLPLSLYLPHISMENAGIAFAAAFLSLIPSVLIFRLGQESLEAGITAT